MAEDFGRWLESQGCRPESLEGIRVGNAARAFPEIEVRILIYTILVIAGTWWLTRRWLTSTVGLDEQESSGDYVDEHAEAVLRTLTAIQAEGDLEPVEVMRSAEVEDFGEITSVLCDHHGLWQEVPFERELLQPTGAEYVVRFMLQTHG